MKKTFILSLAISLLSGTFTEKSWAVGKLFRFSESTQRPIDSPPPSKQENLIKKIQDSRPTAPTPLSTHDKQGEPSLELSKNLLALDRLTLSPETKGYLYMLENKIDGLDRRLTVLEKNRTQENSLKPYS